MAKKQTEAERIANIPIEQIIKMGGEDIPKLRGYVSTLVSGYKRRVQSFAKKDLTSYAQISLENSLPESYKLDVSKLNRNQLLLEFARYSKFFRDVTSSEAGIRQINKDQDVRIFGKDSKGNPIRTLSSEERKAFWDLYDEFKNQNPTVTSSYGASSFTQQVLADAMFGKNPLSSDNLVSFLSEVKKRLQDASVKENLRSVPNVFSGRGTSFTK